MVAPLYFYTLTNQLNAWVYLQSAHRRPFISTHTVSRDYCMSIMSCIKNNCKVGKEKKKKENNNNQKTTEVIVIILLLSSLWYRWDPTSWSLLQCIFQSRCYPRSSVHQILPADHRQYAHNSPSLPDLDIKTAVCMSCGHTSQHLGRIPLSYIRQNKPNARKQTSA